MIGMKIDQAKTMFFDRKKVERSVDRATVRVLSRFGAYVRKTGRESIRKRRRSSSPGQPPSSHTGLLKRFIFFVYDRAKRSVIIGPARLAGKVGQAPEALEYGGRSKATTRSKTYSTYIESRPFMRPAFEQEKPKLPGMWQDSIK